MIGLATNPEIDVGPARHTPHPSDHALPRAGPQRALIEQVTEPVETIRAQADPVVFRRPSTGWSTSPVGLLLEDNPSAWPA